jgi:hypothetical protein
MLGASWARSGERHGVTTMIDPSQFSTVPIAGSPGPVVRESTAGSGQASTDADPSVADRVLRDQFRPEKVRWLFVGESSPTGGTHFYRANSNLFRATREAFAAALGDAEVPDGPTFLDFFRDRGCWLVDLADRPINHLHGRPRQDAVDEGTARLVALVSEVGAERIIVVKATIAGAVRQAAATAGFAGAIIELPFPVRQWRGAYVSRLAEVVRGRDRPNGDDLDRG